MARKHLWYGLTGTVGMGATTIASAQVGDPLPVVIPAVVAGGAVAAHHIIERRENSETDDVDDVKRGDVDADGELDLADPTGGDGDDDLGDLQEAVGDRPIVVIGEEQA